MLIVLASRKDTTAKDLTDRWTAHCDAALLTCEDLSTAGWRHGLTSRTSTAVVSGRVVTVEEITGVLVRTPCIFEQELTHIESIDRAYVAAEMTAFLVSWLSGLKCPVLNRPVPMCLLGPNWRPEQWTYLAARLGIPVRTIRRHVAITAAANPEFADPPSPVAVTVVGDRCVGKVENTLARQAHRIANAAEVDLITIYFSGAQPNAPFLGVSLLPDVTVPDVADAVLQYLCKGSRC